MIELRVGRDVRAYPLQILIWHEIVNDRLGRVPVAVTFCPLCDTAIAFDRRVRERMLSFGTTGDLRNSDLVLVVVLAEHRAVGCTQVGHRAQASRPGGAGAAFAAPAQRLRQRLATASPRTALSTLAS